MLFFWAITLFQVIPFLTIPFFPSLDGPSHLYNANIINSLVFHSNTVFQKYFSINTEPIPNWTSLLLLSILKILFPSYLCEKILLIVLLTGMPYLFRRLIIKIASDGRYYSYLVFPFTHTTFLYLGFYNFCLGILFLLIALIYWISHADAHFKTKHTAVLALLFLMTYFSNPLLFLVLSAIIFIHLCVHSFYQKNRRSVSWQISIFYSKLMTLFAALILPLAFLFYFFFSRSTMQIHTWNTFDQLLRFLQLNYLIEGRNAFLFFWVFACLVIFTISVALVRTLRSSKNREPGHPQPGPGKHEDHANRIWLFLSLIVFLLFYFIAPDSAGSATFINLRILLVIYLLLIAFLASMETSGIESVIAAFLILLINIFVLSSNYSDMRERSNIALACHSASLCIPGNSIVLPVNLSRDPMTGHVTDYLATDRRIMLTSNYEAETGYFPVIWKNKTQPTYYQGTYPDTGLDHAFMHKTACRIDYILEVGISSNNPTSNPKEVLPEFQDGYRLIYSNGYCRVFALK